MKGLLAKYGLNRRMTALTANTAVPDTLIGTPVVPALAADSLIFSNRVATGDIVLAANRGGNSEAGLWIDSSARQTRLYGGGVLGIVVDGANSVVTLSLSLAPTASDGAALGSATLPWSDLYLALGSVINWNNGDMLLTHSANVLAFTGGTYSFDGAVGPSTNDAAALGSATVSWSDLFLASGGVINFGNSDVMIKHNTGYIFFDLSTDHDLAFTAGASSLSIIAFNNAHNAYNTLNFQGSDYTFTAVGAPASVGTTPGTSAGTVLTFTGRTGGATSIGTTGVGGLGGGLSITSGPGGIATAATTSATGGNGGAIAVTSGAGAAEAVAGVTSIGGNSGAVTVLSGNGGAVSAAVSGTATGGRAGIVTLQGGIGGAVTATSGTNVGGIGGDVSVIGGAGGAASGATDTGGRGGILTLTAGAGGTGDTNGAPGYIVRTAGITRRQVQTIDMADAAVTLTLVPGTPTGTLMTSDILYVDANSGTNENLLLPHEADLTGAIIVVVNTGGETINIQNDAGGAVLTLETANTAVVTCDGTTLRGVVGLP